MFWPLRLIKKTNKQTKFFWRTCFSTSSETMFHFGPYRALIGRTVIRKNYRVALYFILTLKGFEWGHLDNTWHLIFWLCNIKQLNLRHFTTNSKRFAVAVNFIQIETKTAPKLAESCPKVIWTFPIICEEFRRLPKISGEKSENISTIYQGRTVHSSLQQGKDVETCIISFTVQRYDFS